jgi:hypothetical protein
MEKILAELVAKMTSINEQQADIERDAALNTEGQFTDEQRASYEALAAMYDQFKAQKVKIEKDMQLVSARSNRAADLTFSLPTNRLSQPNSGAPANVKPRPGTPVEREDENGETRIRFSIPRNIMRVGRPPRSSWPITCDRRTPRTAKPASRATVRFSCRKSSTET